LSDLPRLLLCSFDVIPGPSGSSRRLTEYLKALPDRFSVVVLSAKTPDHSHIEKYQGARLLRVPVGAGDLASRIQAFERAVKRQLDSEEYALAHFTDPFGGYVLCEMKGDYGYRLIYEAQTFPSQDLRYTHPQLEGDKRFLAKIRRQELFCLMNADLVITGSQTTRSYIQSLGASTEQTRVMRAPVDLTPYTPDVLGVPDGEPMRLMYLGSQAGWQGLPTLMRAMSLAVEQGVEVKLTLVGPRSPDWQPHLEDLAQDLRIQEHVEFQPPVLHDDLVKVLALADVGVLPLEDVDRNRLQGGPLAKASEYFAAGRPLLAADLPVTRELLPSPATLFHTPGDAKALADSIVELARDVPRRLEMGRAARSFAEQVLDAGLIRGKLLDIYDELLGKRTSVGTPSEMPEPTVTGTPTNRLAQFKPPEGRRSRGKGKKSSSGTGKQSSQESARDELPLVVGQALLDDGLDTRLIKTEPDARPAEPPVVMGLPLRDEKPSATAEGPTLPAAIGRPPAAQRREEPAEPPTSIVNVAPAREAPPSIPTPTPVVRATQGSGEEAPAAASARTSEPVREEEPPTPTPIVPMKTVAGGRLTEDARPEQDSSRAPAPPATPPTATRSAPKEPAPATPTASTRTAPKEPSPGTPPAGTRTLQEPPPATPSPGPRTQPESLPPILSPSPRAPQEALPPPVLSPSPRAPQEAPPAAPSASTRGTQQEVPPALPPAGTRGAPKDSPPVLPSTSTRSAPQEPARVQEPADKARQPSLPPVVRGPVTSEAKGPPPRLLPVDAPAAQIPPPLPRPTKVQEEPEDLPEEEALELADDSAIDAAPTPPHPRPRMDEPEELSSDEVEEADAADAVEAADDQVETADDAVEPVDDDVEHVDDAVEPVDDDVEHVDDEVESVDDEVEAVEDDAGPETKKPQESNGAAVAAAAEPTDAPPLEPPDSALDPWFAQLAHGYCPPEGAQFARHTPPTNFPGRDQDPTDPSRLTLPPTQVEGASRGKRS
jgi:glycosyltransferase involved in cell wall biosynthesis